MLRDFAQLMSSRFFFTLGIQIQAVVIGWRMYELTHDPLSLGLIGLAEAVPALGLALYAGYIVDRNKPLRIYFMVVACTWVSSLVLMASQSGWLALSDQKQVTALYFSSFISGLARAFAQPSLYAAMPRMVPQQLVPQATAWSMTTLQVARITGPALGGILFGFWGIETAIAWICAFLMLSMCSLLWINAVVQAPQRQDRPVSIKEELVSGLRYVFRHPILLPALSMDMFSVLFGGVTALLPIFASDVLHVGPRGLGILRAAPAIGAVLTSLWLTKKDLRENAGRWLISGAAGFGICILVFGMSRSFELSCIALALAGASDSISMVIRGAAVQLCSPDSMRGRISAVNSIFIGSSNELGELESGVAAKVMGTVPCVIFGGVMCVLIVLLTAWLSPTLRKMDLGKIAAA